MPGLIPPQLLAQHRPPRAVNPTPLKHILSEVEPERDDLRQTALLWATSQTHLDKVMPSRRGRTMRADMNDNTTRPILRIRIVFGEEDMFGPGKIELLERIDRCGSIAAAGREMGTRYKRAWQLIGTRNAMFREPLGNSTRGGPGGGGAVLTKARRQVLSLYRAFEADAAAAGAAPAEAMRALLRNIPEGR